MSLVLPVSSLNVSLTLTRQKYTTQKKNRIFPVLPIPFVDDFPLSLAFISKLSSTSFHQKYHWEKESSTIYTKSLIKCFRNESYILSAIMKNYSTFFSCNNFSIMCMGKTYSSYSVRKKFSFTCSFRREYLAKINLIDASRINPCNSSMQTDSDNFASE